MIELLSSCIYASLGTLGFGLVFNANKKKLIYIFIGGFLNIFFYEITLYFTKNIFLSSLVCASITYIYSTVMAYFTKSPSIIYILTGLIPSVPGSSLFYMMQNIVLTNNTLSIVYAKEVVLTILGIACGIALFSVVVNLYKDLNKGKKKHTV